MLSLTIPGVFDASSSFTAWFTFPDAIAAEKSDFGRLDCGAHRRALICYQAYLDKAECEDDEHWQDDGGLEDFRAFFRMDPYHEDAHPSTVASFISTALDSIFMPSPNPPAA